MHVIITGGSGFVGSRLSMALAQGGHRVTIVDLAPPRSSVENVDFVTADLMHDSVPDVFAHADAIIHLAGVSVFKRWTPSYKELIIDSRVKTADVIYDYLSRVNTRPAVFVSASAVGYYGDRGEEQLGEEAVPGDDFLAGVCEKWEAAARKFDSLGMRTVSIRTAIVLGPGGGMMSQVVPLFRYGLGGKMGKGTQWFSWIHIDDLVAVYTKAITSEVLKGPVNASAPGALQNKAFARALGRALHRPAFIPAPAFALRLVLGEFASAVLSSARVVPQKLQSQNFMFQYPDIDSALTHSL
jgi:uncharacterized protein (TIGR01777 family)